LVVLFEGLKMHGTINHKFICYVPLALDSEVGKAKRKRNENVSGFKKNTFGWMM
jgi:hypothetical protein